MFVEKQTNPTRVMSEEGTNQQQYPSLNVDPCLFAQRFS